MKKTLKELVDEGFKPRTFGNHKRMFKEKLGEIQIYQKVNSHYELIATLVENAKYRIIESCRLGGKR